MPTFLVEQPWIIGIIGAVVTIAALFGWLQSGNPIALRSGIGLAVASILLVVMNLWIVTDSEIIHTWVMDVANELEQNQVQKVKDRVHPQATNTVASRMNVLDHIQFESVRVTKIHSIDVKTTGDLKTAVVHMNVLAQGKLDGTPGKVPRWIGLNLETLKGKWLVVDVQEKDPLHEFMNRE
jgi:hypothetical protein